MGIVLSTIPGSDGVDGVITTNKLILSEKNVAQLVSSYTKHQFLPVVPVPDLRNLFEVSFGHKTKLEDNSPLLEALTVSQKVFRDGLTVNTQEVLVGLVLICDAPWPTRAALLFDIFKCVGSEEMGYDDLLLASQMVVMVLCRLWGTHRWSAKTINSLTEAIADAAFTRLNKEIDEFIDHKKFVTWAMERFHESIVIDNSESLKRLYQSPHIPV